MLVDVVFRERSPEKRHTTLKSYSTSFTVGRGSWPPKNGPARLKLSTETNGKLPPHRVVCSAEKPADRVDSMPAASEEYTCDPVTDEKTKVHRFVVCTAVSFEAIEGVVAMVSKGREGSFDGELTPPNDRDYSPARRVPNEPRVKGGPVNGLEGVSSMPESDLFVHSHS